MKLKRLLPAACGIAALSASASAEPASGTLHVRITGFKSSQGELAIALFDSASDYEKLAGAVRREFVPIHDGSSRWIVEDLPAGEYAVVAYHDENGNREIDMRIFGMPREPVAVSNDARGAFGPPGFDAAKFELRPPVTRLTIELR